MNMHKLIAFLETEFINKNAATNVDENNNTTVVPQNNIIETKKIETVNTSVQHNWYEERKEEKENLFRLLDETTNYVISDLNIYKEFLEFMSAFYKYSIGNIILVFSQNKKATILYDMENIKSQNLSIKKGEKAIKILEPSTQYTRVDGSIGTNYIVKKIFDVTQLKADVKRTNKDNVKKDILLALLDNKPCDISACTDIKNNQFTFYDEDTNTIKIKKDLTTDEMFNALLKEFISIHLKKTGISNNIDLISTSVSYALCNSFKFNAKEMFFNDVKTAFQNKKEKEIRKELSQIRAAFNEFFLKIMNSLVKQENKGV